ncbi:calpastatin isoform X5 [Notamacropus eugenii]|uniref:calpastatin isoform X5 n=1 Tax=Notamacropus eugenii TaxID=9315 RepID=UPI003B672E13
MAFASWWYKTHGSGKNSGTPSKAGEKKQFETTEDKTASHSSSHPSRISASRTASSKASTSFPASTSTPSMNPTETKAKKAETEEKSQSTKATEPRGKDVHVEKPKEDEKQKSSSKQLLATETKDSLAGKETLKPSDQPTAGKPTEDPQKKENKALRPSTPLKDQSSKPSEESSLNDALDNLIDTLGGPEEDKPESPEYTGPPVSELLSSTYIEELGKRESTIPPEYRKLLESHEGAATGPPDTPKPMGEDEAIDSLSSDFTCSSAVPGKATDKEKASGEEVLKAQSVDLVKSAVPPDEKKRRIGELYSETASKQALDDLCETLGSPEVEPEIDTSSYKEVDEAKSREERLKKCGEREDTIPEDYQLKPVMDKDGKPLLPKPEEKPKPVSESKLVDELSKDFERSEPQGKQSKPAEKTKKSKSPAPAPVKEVVSKTSMCVVQETPQKPAPKPKGAMPDDAVEALAGSLAKKETDPEENKPAVDKVKEKSKEEKREKLGEKEETIPPEYRLKEAKDEDRKLLDKKQSEKISPMSDDDILDALSEGFSCSKAPVTHAAAVSVAPKSKDKKHSSEATVMADPTPEPSTVSASPRDTSQENEGLDDALDQLSKSLGEQTPDPDENKPMEDKVKEKTKAEHRDKLGERDDTIPPEYRNLLDNDDQGSPAKPPPKEPKSSASGGDPIDVLSEGFDNCSQTPSPEDPKKLTTKKDEKEVSSTKPAKNGGKSKTKEKSSKSKANGEKTS